jgi:hypothetical protein
MKNKPRSQANATSQINHRRTAITLRQQEPNETAKYNQTQEQWKSTALDLDAPLMNQANTTVEQV